MQIDGMQVAARLLTEVRHLLRLWKKKRKRLDPREGVRGIEMRRHGRTTAVAVFRGVV